jgi:hypothetical protein
MPIPRPTIWLIPFLLLLAGCGPSAPNTPIEVVREYCRLANAGHYPEAAALLEPAMAKLLLLAPGAPESELTLLEAQSRQWTKDGTIMEVRPLRLRQDGPAAVVDVRISYRDGSERTGAFALWQTGTDWRIASNGLAE